MSKDNFECHVIQPYLSDHSGVFARLYECFTASRAGDENNLFTNVRNLTPKVVISFMGKL